MNRGNIYNPSFKMNHYVPLRLTRRSGQVDRTLRLVLPATKQLSCDWTLTNIRSALTECIQSALTGRIQSRKLLSRTLLMLIRLWHPASSHFAAQHPVSSRNLTSVWSALTGCVQSGFLSRTLLELTGLWHPVFGHSPLSVWSHRNQRLVSI